ncbi:hypothetical protein AMATHDRAFT_4797 [Amanita thiersii Skay4041]|uniref:Uncharacterized protein n=1 Tax=Amanita thiersii Skay4041 TaxID=703135 RepID=A0A2A9NPB0_9AGAR|nr:hypothetical protein AMATHDRAFT_4797 [Amanita thiersii Skay4041]
MASLSVVELRLGYRSPESSPTPTPSLSGSNTGTSDASTSSGNTDSSSRLNPGSSPPLIVAFLAIGLFTASMITVFGWRKVQFGVRGSSRGGGDGPAGGRHMGSSGGGGGGAGGGGHPFGEPMNRRRHHHHQQQQQNRPWDTWNVGERPKLWDVWVDSDKGTNVNQETSCNLCWDDIMPIAVTKLSEEVENVRIPPPTPQRPGHRYSTTLPGRHRQTTVVEHAPATAAAAAIQRVTHFLRRLCRRHISGESSTAAPTATHHHHHSQEDDQVEMKPVELPYRGLQVAVAILMPSVHHSANVNAGRSLVTSPSDAGGADQISGLRDGSSMVYSIGLYKCPWYEKG